MLRAAMAALMFMCLLAPAIGRADADTTPPVLVALTLPASVETGPAGVDVPVTARITDDLSGVAASDVLTACSLFSGLPTQIALRAPSNTVFIGEIFDARGGDDYEAVLHLPRYAQAGNWAVDRVVLTDCASNSRTLSGAQLAAAGFPASVLVTGVGDAAPPALSALAISPPSVETSAAGAAVIVTATITDNLSGVAASDPQTACGDFTVPPSALSFRSPSGSAFVGRSFDALGGDAYRATVNLPAFAEAGIWTVSNVLLIDCAHNQLALGPSQLAALGFPTSFEVTGVGDGTPPVISALSIAPSVVDTRAAEADVVFSARLTDDVSGVSTWDSPAGCAGFPAQVDVESPSHRFFAGTLRLRSGDDYDTSVTLPRFSEAGTWTVRMILADCAGNTRHLSSSDLAALGFPSTFRVLPPEYEFGGFFAPLSADGLAHRHPGSGMAVKFRLGGADGTDIFDPGFPQVQAIDCATRQPLDDAVPLGPTEWVFQGLADGVYHYKWKSSHEWRNVCRRLIVGFDDGSRHTADVHFR